MSAQPLSCDRSSAAAALKFVPAQILIERGKEIHGLIARRAYELFERRDRALGFDVDDWRWAESELLYSCRHDLKNLPGAIVLKAELPGSFTADELEVSIEPRRLMVSGEKKVDAIYGDPKGDHAQRMPERIYRVHELPLEVDPSKAAATLKGQVLEIVMPKVTRATQVLRQQKTAEQGG
ncbi:MAG: DUF2934 domain-containing protein [Terriglobia bacterium]